MSAVCICCKKEATGNYGAGGPSICWECYRTGTLAAWFREDTTRCVDLTDAEFFKHQSSEPCQNPGCHQLIVQESEEICKQCGHHIADDPPEEFTVPKVDVRTEDQPPIRPEKRFTAELDTNLSAGPSWFVIDLQRLFMGVPTRSWVGDEVATRAAVERLNQVPTLDKPIETHDYTRNRHPDWYSNGDEDRTKHLWPPGNVGSLKTFHREYLGRPWEPTEEERKLEALAKEYDERVETFDAAEEAKLGTPGRSAVHPIMLYDRCRQHAREVRAEMATRGEALGFTRRQVYTALADYRRKKMKRPPLMVKNYAPFGVGLDANQFWLHIGSYTIAFSTLDAAKRYGSQNYPLAACYIRRRGGQLMATKELGKSTWEDV
jgi:hypothetical protein